MNYPIHRKEMPSWLHIGQKVFESSSIGTPMYGTVTQWIFDEEERECVKEIGIAWDLIWVTKEMPDVYDVFGIADGPIFPVTEEIANEEPQMLGLEGVDPVYER